MPPATTTISTSSSACPSSSSSRADRGSSAFIQSGDLVIIYASRDKTPIPLTVTPGEHVSNMFGHFLHDDMIGMPYGSKMISRNRRGYVYLLRPTPELWTLALPHRTQILYAPDMSFISMKLNMGPGSRVIEAGTGSGSFSHFIARTVGRSAPERISAPSASSVNDQAQVPRNWKGLPNHLQQNLSRGRGQPKDADELALESEPDQQESSKLISVGADQAVSPSQGIEAHVPEGHGRLWSFEFHEPRADKARAEFAAHGMDRVIVLNHRNVCKDGFGLSDAADSVFLDLPAPWEAIGFAKQALRRKTVARVCCFSPCIEQVLKTVTALTEHGFADIETFESLVRTHESMAASGPEVSIDEAISRIRTVERRKETRRLLQIEKSRNQRLGKAQSAAETSKGESREFSGVSQKRKFDAGETEQDDGTEDSADDGEAEASSNANEATANGSHNGNDAKGSVDSDASTEPTYQRGIDGGVAVTKKKAKLLQQLMQKDQPIQPASVFSRPYHEMRGHTSYLTFATLLPRDMPSGAS
ncbi:GCD14-domain-containing protein [Testicularia cyperi]|uniref:tRNA (adenine(58)-N(1))-methyltransferase catalytic subunit TRM61 n=1 Tax=Testicularia cyperi TaxID=1882483 RepID=A0A317XRN6_9BASI|nr:GCD14-domain-containing protein [Testicularia cyperi]